MKKILILFLIPLLLAASCKKENTSSIEDQLPPATETGANTFGCKVNGIVYIPKGYDGTGTPNPKIIFDNGLNGLPYLQINAKQYNETAQVGNLIIYIDSLSGTGEHKIYTSKMQIGFGWYLIPGCGILANDNIQYKSGGVQITKYDLTNGIISGLFTFKIKPSNCDTLFFTDGRFDFKL